MMASTAPTVVGASDEWPSFNAELTRKTTEQLQLWMQRYDEGKISAKTALMILSVLYDTTSGMIEKDVSTLIATIHTDLMREVKEKS